MPPAANPTRSRATWLRFRDRTVPMY